MPLAGAVPNTGEYTLNVPNKKSDKCIVRVAAAQNPAVWGKSDGYFTIRAPKPLPSLKLISPNGNEIWKKGGQETVKWAADPSITHVGISISEDGGAHWHLVVERTPNTGQYKVTVPEKTSKNCLIWIFDTAPDPFFGVPDKDPMDVSDAPFEIS